MNSQNIFNFVQLATGLAVIIGLGLVVWELNQTREFARLNYINTNLDLSYQRNLTLMGENAASVELRACINPEALTDEQLAVAWAALSTRYNRIFNTLYIERIVKFGSPTKEIVRPWLRTYLGFPLGFWDYQSQTVPWDPVMKEIADDIVAKNEVISCEALWQPMKEKFGKKESANNG